MRVEALQRGPGVVGVGGGVDRPQRGGDLLAVAVGDVAHPGADLVHDARLHPGLGEDGRDRLREPVEAVDAADQHVTDAALVEIVEHGEPELRALALAPPDPEHLALALQRDADRQIAGAVSDGAVLADLHDERVEVDDRVDLIQRPRAPRLHVGQHGVGDAADRVTPHLDAVELAELRLDLTDREAAGIEREDLVVQARRGASGACRPTAVRSSRRGPGAS